MSKSNLFLEASRISEPWHSVVIGQAAGANVKVLRMDDRPYPDETHEFAEALLVLQGQMSLDIQGHIVCVQQGEVFIVPAGIPHAVAPGSHGTLVIVDQ